MSTICDTGNKVFPDGSKHHSIRRIPLHSEKPAISSAVISLVSIFLSGKPGLDDYSVASAEMGVSYSDIAEVNVFRVDTGLDSSEILGGESVHAKDRSRVNGKKFSTKD